jgi:KDO2-lipid IV(A) lauroyltransferase
MNALEKITVILIKSVIWLFRVVPYPVAIAAGRAIAAIAYLLASKERKIARVQMKAALGDAFRPEMVREVFLHNADVFVDTIRYAFMNDAEIAKKIKIAGAENLRAAQSSGRGVMLIISHAENWEIPANVSRMLNVEFCVMADLRDNTGIATLVNDIRRRTGVTLLPPTGKILMLVKELRRGRTIAFIVDKRGEKGTELYCDFFGMPALTNPAPAFVASKGDAIIVPVYSERKGYSYSITICPGVDAGTFPGDVIQSISDFMQTWTESVIRKRPAHWTWAYSRWIRRSEIKEVIKKGLDFREFVISKAAGKKEGKQHDEA